MAGMDSACGWEDSNLVNISDMQNKNEKEKGLLGMWMFAVLSTVYHFSLPVTFKYL